MCLLHATQYWMMVFSKHSVILAKDLHISDLIQTVLCEVESILNSRPLTKESTDLNDLEAPNLAFHPVCFAERIVMHVAVGDKYNTFLICFEGGG